MKTNENVIRWMRKEVFFMNCPKCNEEMKVGFIDHSHWISGQKPWGELYLSFTRRTAFVVAYKCPKCNCVELVAEEEKKQNKE